MNALVRREWLHWTLVVAMFVTAALVWPWAPERMPAHWNAQGQIDGYGGKFLGVLGLPLVSLGMYLFMLLVRLVDPGRANYPGFSRALSAIRLMPLVVFAALYAVALLTSFGHPVSMNLVVLLVTGIVFLVIGNYMGKIRPNWFFGVRTPWTLSSKLSWTKTHQAAGRVFVGIGLVTLVAAFLPGAWSVGVFLTALIGASLGLVPYSYLVWRRDPERVPPAGTGPAES